MKKNLVSKSANRKANVKEWQTKTIINEIFDLSDKIYKDSIKINTCLKELKLRGVDDVYAYYRQYINRVVEGEVDIKQINPHHALNEVLKLNEAEKIWDFVNVLDALANETNFKVNYEKISKAMAKTGDIKNNLYWAEIYTVANKDNIKVILNSKDAKANERLVRLVDNLTKEEKEKAKKIVRNAKVKLQKSEGKKSEGKKDAKKKVNKPDNKENKKSSGKKDEEDRLMELETEELISFMEQSKRESRKKAQDDIHQM